jgi:N-acetylglucosaminyldiphosphoundecaprenol N-acetyl-beta-D-mannosaminyltransferase
MGADGPQMNGLIPYTGERRVVCMAGLPFDVVSLQETVGHVCEAMRARQRLFLSTPNLNFLIAAQSDQAFRDSVIHSDLSVADGIPIVWLARLLGYPIRERVAGSSLFEVLRNGSGQALLGRPISVYFFGGPPGVAERAAQVLNAEGRFMTCVGHHCPGFGGVMEMSSPEVIEAINLSGADFLVVALGARKGQAWIEQNLPVLTVPVVSHLGAVVNFVAGMVERAPVKWQHLGLEWLWRIKEEPSLFRRYWSDGLALMRLLATRILPLALIARNHGGGNGGVEANASGFVFFGCLGEQCLMQWRESWPRANAGACVSLDFSAVEGVLPVFTGGLLLYEKWLYERNSSFRIIGTRPRVRREFMLNGLEGLLAG